MEGAGARQQELMAEVQRHPIRLAELAHEESVKVLNSSKWISNDKEIEFDLGEKERALGALRGHQQEHGC